MLSYAVEVLKVRHIIVCGHYGCGGVAAALTNQQFGLIDNWLRNIKDVYLANKELIEEQPPGDCRTNLLVEFNVARSVVNVCHTTIVQNAWANGQELSVHGWVYGLDDGIVHPLPHLEIKSAKQIDEVFWTFEKKVAPDIKKEYISSTTHQKDLRKSAK